MLFHKAVSSVFILSGIVNMVIIFCVTAFAVFQVEY